jgi:beta-glucosidase
MTLDEKASFVVLRAANGYENTNTGVPELCLPPLTMQDSPNGIASGDTGVTQLPASLGIAASFNPQLAYEYGKVLGAEAHGKGIDVVQGPNLNLLRIPESGRAFEGYGEDPYLVSEMGDADIEGIQSVGVMAEAKHFTAYNQETARSTLNQKVSRRALEELYLAPFAAAVRYAHVASIMCAYGSLNGVNDCSSPLLYKTLYRKWKSPGFVRSDLASVKNIAAAFNAGMSLVKPAKSATIVSEVEDHQLKITALNEAVRRVLLEMFAYGFIDHPVPETPKAEVATPAHADFAMSAAEQSMVLLKNRGILPLSRSLRSIAVIGVDAGKRAMSAGHGSARVIPPFLVTPISALRRLVSPQTRVTYAPGEPQTSPFAAIPRADYRSGKPLPVTPSSFGPHHRNRGKSDLGIISAPGVTRAVETADRPLKGPYPWTTWNATIDPPRSGLYDLSLTENGDTWLKINGRSIFSFRGLHGRNTTVVAVRLVGGHAYHFDLDWFQAGKSVPRLLWQDVTPAIAQAVKAAKHARIAVVFVNDFNSESLDRPNLELSGDANALVEAVDKANPRTIVVLNTGGAVLMPWLKKVSAVLEAWYPGEEDGSATAKVLFGMVDPSGRLPVTFPTSDAAVPAHTPAQWPGIDGTVTYSEGLDIGYRWYEAKGVKPLFPFGFGLSYTSFQLGGLRLTDSGKSDEITLSVKNTGRRSGTDVVQCYLAYPTSAGEPPLQLRSFARVELQPGAKRMVTLHLERRDFTSYLGGRFTVPAGSFTAWVGSSSSNLPDAIAVTAPTS